MNLYKSWLAGTDLTIFLLHCHRFELVTRCWADKPANRPTFSDIVTALSQHLEGYSGYTLLAVGEDEKD